MSGQHRHSKPHVVAVCGLRLEARAAAGEGVAVACGGDKGLLTEAIHRAMTPATRGIISFGFAGGLVHGLRTGTCIVARNVLGRGDGQASDTAWSRSLLKAMPTAMHADLISTDRPIHLPSEKLSLHRRTGAVAVDLESHIVARIAHERGLPFAVVRVVLDPAHRRVPKSALIGHAADGSADARAVLAALAVRPHDSPAVMRLAVDFWTASRALFRGRRQLGERFAFVDVGEHALDVA